MGSKEDKYRQLFHAEAYESYEQLNQLFISLEKDPTDLDAIKSVFRITHTLKGNAMAFGLDGIAQLNHVMEDLFAKIRDGEITLTQDLFNTIFLANDKLSDLVEAIKTKEEVPFEAIVKDLRSILENPPQQETASNVKSTDKTTKQPETKRELPDRSITFSDQIQVPVSKLDSLMDMVGELMIEKDAVANKIDDNIDANILKRLNRLISDLQYSIMDVRLVQIGELFEKFHRIVRDVAQIEGKRVELQLKGTEIEIDRNILKVISDSLVHIVRNCVSHGIESEEDRKAADKSPQGLIRLEARNEKDTVYIMVTDDGKGIDPVAIRKKAIEKQLLTAESAKLLKEEDIINIIFEPGFSNAEAVNEISGRGVGMDVVKKSTESIGGRVSVESSLGIGTVITLALPSTLSVKGALLFTQDNQEYGIPIMQTEAVFTRLVKDIQKIGRGLMTTYLEHPIPVIFLRDIFEANSMLELAKKASLHAAFDAIEQEDVNIIVINYSEKRFGIAVDTLLYQKEIVEKQLAKPLHKVDLFTGATILGNGNVCLILNIPILIEYLFSERTLVSTMNKTA